MKQLCKKDLFNEILNKCSSVKKRLWIASPYIGSNNFVRYILGDKWKANAKINFNLLVDYTDKQNCDPRTLRKLMDSGATVRSLKALHAKIYIFDDEMVLTSANLSDTAFRKRYEIGASLNKYESIEFIKYYSEIWKKGKILNTTDLMNEKKFRKRFGRSREEKSSGFKVLFNIKIPKLVKQKYWLKISGDPNPEERIKQLDMKETLESGFVHTKKGRSKGGKPSFRKGENILLSRMGMNGTKKDHYIYGKAKVDIPYRDKIDNQIKFIKYISNDGKKYIPRINRWPYGVWLKDMEIINTKNSNFLWISDLEDENGINLINPKSLNQQSHIKIDDKQFKKINELLEKKFKKYGKKEEKKPLKNWINEFITDKRNWSTRQLTKNNWKIIIGSTENNEIL